MTECLSRVSKGVGRGFRAPVGSLRGVFFEEVWLSTSARQWVCVGGWGVGGAGLEKNKTRSEAQPGLGSVRGWGRGCSGTDPAFLRDGHRRQGGPFPKDRAGGGTQLETRLVHHVRC